MGKKFVDCFMLMGTALSLQRGDQSLTEMGRPVLQDVVTTAVNVSITLQDIHFISVKSMKVQFTFLLHQRWTDPRLGPNAQTKRLAVNGQIWRPWITSTEGEIKVSENDITQFWRGMAPEGNIIYSERLVLKTFCTRNFRKFPFDTQKCEIKLGSYRFTKEEIELIWGAIPVEILTGEILDGFQLIDVKTYSEIEVRTTGNFTVLVLELTIKRFYEHYLFCIFMPCLFLIFMSYFTFFINPDMINIRYFISTISLCFLFYLYQYSVCSTIAVSYLKALDISVLCSICFVLISLLENIIIDIGFRKDEYEEYGSRYFHKIRPNYNIKYKILDRVTCVLFPVMFACVVLFYYIAFVM